MCAKALIHYYGGRFIFAVRIIHVASSGNVPLGYSRDLLCHMREERPRHHVRLHLVLSIMYAVFIHIETVFVHIETNAVFRYITVMVGYINAVFGYIINAVFGYIINAVFGYIITAVTWLHKCSVSLCI